MLSCLNSIVGIMYKVQKNKYGAMTHYNKNDTNTLYQVDVWDSGCFIHVVKSLVLE